MAAVLLGSQESVNDQITIVNGTAGHRFGIGTYNYQATGISLLLYRDSGTFSGDISISLYETDEGLPTGSPLGTVSMAASSLATSGQWITTLNFSAPIPMTKGTAYAIALSWAGDATHRIYWRYRTELSGRLSYDGLWHTETGSHNWRLYGYRVPNDSTLPDPEDGHTGLYVATGYLKFSVGSYGSGGTAYIDDAEYTTFTGIGSKTITLTEALSAGPHTWRIDCKSQDSATVVSTGPEWSFTIIAAPTLDERTLVVGDVTTEMTAVAYIAGAEADPINAYVFTGVSGSITHVRLAMCRLVYNVSGVLRVGIEAVDSAGKPDGNRLGSGLFAATYPMAMTPSLGSVDELPLLVLLEAELDTAVDLDAATRYALVFGMTVAADTILAGAISSAEYFTAGSRYYFDSEWVLEEGDAPHQIDQSKPKYAQMFTPAIGLASSFVELTIAKETGATCNVSIGIYATDAGLPTGTALATATITAAEITGDFGYVSAALSTAIDLTASTEYAVVLELVAPGASDIFYWESAGFNLGHNEWFYSDGAWQIDSFVAELRYGLYGSISTLAAPINPAPSTGASNLQVGTRTLTWEDGAQSTPATSYNVVVTDTTTSEQVASTTGIAPLDIGGGTIGASYTLPEQVTTDGITRRTMVYSHSYSWQVTAVGATPEDTATSTLWTFGTWNPANPRADDYDPDSQWQYDSGDGVYGWYDIDVAGGGRYKPHLVIVSHKCIYFD